LQNLKVLRHPGIVKFLSLRTTSEADLLITEHVRPLMEVIDTMTPGEISVGLYSILEALSFLHEMVRSVTYEILDFEHITPFQILSDCKVTQLPIFCPLFQGDPWPV
jgi:serine/threonine protein kinase